MRVQILTCAYYCRVGSDGSNVLDFVEKYVFLLISRDIYEQYCQKPLQALRSTTRRPGERPARPWGATRLGFLEILENHLKSQFSADPELQIEYL